MGSRKFIPENYTVDGPMVEAFEVVTLKAGQSVVKGEVLAKDGAEYVAWADGADAVRVASEDADATDEATTLSVWKGGNMNFKRLTLPDNTEATAISDTLWVNNIHIETNISGGN